MKKWIIPLAIMAVIRCAAPEPAIPPNSDSKTLEMKEIGTDINMYLPVSMDSLVVWDSDCCTGGLNTACFWDTGFSFVKTMHGLCFSSILPDSICQTTVYWRDQENNEFKIDSVAMINTMRHIEPLEKDAYYRKVNWEISRIETIGSQRFIFLAFKNFIHNSWVNDREKCCETLFLLTAVNGQSVEIWFECAGKQCNGFVDKILPYARTIRFSKNEK
jgi:hypothetical protein